MRNAKGLALKIEKSNNESFHSREISDEEWQKVEKERSLEQTMGGVKEVVNLLLAKTIEHREWDSYDKTAKDGSVKTIPAGSIDMASGEAMAKIFNLACPSGYLHEGELVKFSAGGFRNQGLKVVKLA